jgi:hypothetical protein
MDCQEVRELLDAYALGAAEKHEAEAVENHVADCVRCWDELSKAQQSAAMLALSVPVLAPPERIGRRLMDRAARETSPRGPRTTSRAGGFRLGWQTAAAVLGVASIAALAFAGFLQVQVTDLQDEKSDLANQVQAAGTEAAQQKQIVAVLSAPDAQKIPMSAVTAQPNASVVYNWSRSATKGFLVCQDLPPSGPDQSYQVWFKVSGQPRSVTTFQSSDGTCQVAMDLSVLHGRPDGIGISVEKAGGSEAPTGKWLMYADFPHQ